jgi:serine/threonine protein kinase
MPPVSSTQSGASAAFTKRPGEEPIPGYVLLEPLGRGGFGEVWKCLAPGGLHKAIKFVTGGDDDVLSGRTGRQLKQELSAFQQIKSIRHPFLLTLERAEIVGDELLMVMELADRQLADRFNECRQAGMSGIPRDELIGYLLDAAEVLDLISNQFGLQHLDVKPANLFIVTGHVKVGDYGLVRRLDGSNLGAATAGGLTPRYVAPEVLRGQVHNNSDQYSLALVYYELLTAKFPYRARSTQEFMLQHVSAAPDLSALTEPDYSAVGRALSKDPADRFPSCMDFVLALMGMSSGTHRMASRSRLGLLETPTPASPPAASRTAPLITPPSTASSKLAAPTHSSARADEPTKPNAPSAPPGLQPPTARPKAKSLPPGLLITPGPAPPARSSSDRSRPIPTELAPTSGVRLNRIRSVVPVSRLLGEPDSESPRPPDQVVRAIFQAASAGIMLPPEPGALIQAADGTWVCRFLSTIHARIAPVKLDLLWEEGGVTMDTRQEGFVVFQKPMPAPTGFFAARNKQKCGFEVVVQLYSPSAQIGEVLVIGRYFGNPPQQFIDESERTMMRLIEGVRTQLNNTSERRRHPRVPSDMQVTVFPLHSDGGVDPPLAVRCKDLSLCGVALRMEGKPPAKYGYLCFNSIPSVAGMGVLAKFIRSEWLDNEMLVGAHYRLDLGSE